MHTELSNLVNRKKERINSEMDTHHEKKFRRDGLNVIRCMETTSNFKRKWEITLRGGERTNNQNRETTGEGVENSESTNQNYTAEDITEGVDIPSHEPIVLTDNPMYQEEAVKSLLAKGPSFIPTPNGADWNQLHLDYERFCNDMRKKIHFYNPEENSQEQQQTATDAPKKPSTWKAPRSNIPEAEIFLKQIEKDLFSDVQRKNVQTNLSKEEKKALQQCRLLLNNPDTTDVIRMQDKGNKFVIVDKETDINKAKEQIKKSSMEVLTEDPTQEIIQKVEEWCTRWKNSGHLTNEWEKHIINKEATAARNNPLYKTHKAGTPVRLLTSGCNSATEGLSLFVEKKCAPLAQNLRSRIKDTSHMLDLIDEMNEGGIPESAILVSLDIENMFPSIDNARGLQTIRERLEKEEGFPLPTECIMEAIELILTNNNSKFNGTHYLQKNGTATGAKNSCSYSDLALEPIDEEIFKCKSTIFKELLVYYRYRDDCFIIWDGSMDMLKRFVYLVNILDPSLKFTVEIGGKSLKYLDLYIRLVNGRLSTTVYSKPTDGHLYLHNASCHPANTKRAVQHGTALRLRRICSTEEEFQSKSKDYKAYLVSRGHNPNEVVETFEKISNVSRTEARKKVVDEENQAPTKTRFITKFNPHHPDIYQIIKKHDHILRTSATLNKIFPRGSFQIVNKREKNLKEIISRADPYVIKPAILGSYKTCDRTCDSCRTFANDLSEFKCNATGRIFKLHKEMNCNTPNVIYVCECKKCNEQGVGSTVCWKPRQRNYKSWVKNQIRKCRIGNHFIDNVACRGPDHAPWENMKFYIIDCVDNFDGLTLEQIDEELLKKEKMWIRKLLTYHHGMNSSHDLNRSRRSDLEKLD